MSGGVRVLVTGGAGFIGSHVVDLLLAEGHEVAIYDSLVEQVHGSHPEADPDVPASPDDPGPWWPEWCMQPSWKTVHKCRGDVRDAALVGTFLRAWRPHVVIHLAAEVGVGQAERAIERYVDTNVRGTAVVLEQILHANQTATGTDGVRRLVVAGSMSSYGEGPSICSEHGMVRNARADDAVASGVWDMRCPYDGCTGTVAPLPSPEWVSLRPAGVYAATKRDQEEYALLVGRSSGLSVAVARFFNVYGPRQALGNPYTGVAAIFAARCMRGLPPLVYEDGMQSRDLVHVSDVARAVVTMAGSPVLRSAMREWASASFGGVFNVGTGKPTTILDIANIACATLAPQLTPEVTGSYRMGDIRACVADTSRITDLLAWVPRVPVETGLRQLFEAWAKETPPAGDLDRAHVEIASAGLVLGGTAGYRAPTQAELPDRAMPVIPEITTWAETVQEVASPVRQVKE